VTDSPFFSFNWLVKVAYFIDFRPEPTPRYPRNIKYLPVKE
jgi:hypothetical protein